MESRSPLAGMPPRQHFTQQQWQPPQQQQAAGAAPRSSYHTQPQQQCYVPSLAPPLPPPLPSSKPVLSSYAAPPNTPTTSALPTTSSTARLFQQDNSTVFGETTSRFRSNAAGGSSQVLRTGAPTEVSSRLVSSRIVSEVLMSHVSPEDVEEVEEQVVGETTVRVPRKQIVDNVIQRPATDCREVVVERPEICVVDRVVEIPQIVETVSTVPVRKVIEVEKETLKPVYVPEVRQVVQEVEVPGEIREVIEKVPVERKIDVPVARDEAVPVVVAQTMIPRVSETSREKMPVKVRILTAKLCPVDVYVPKPVLRPLVIKHRVDYHQRVEISTAHRNTLLRQMNADLAAGPDANLLQQLYTKNARGAVEFLLHPVPVVPPRQNEEETLTDHYDTRLGAAERPLAAGRATYAADSAAERPAAERATYAAGFAADERPAAADLAAERPPGESVWGRSTYEQHSPGREESADLLLEQQEQAAKDMFEQQLQHNGDLRRGVSQASLAGSENSRRPSERPLSRRSSTASQAGQRSNSVLLRRVSESHEQSGSSSENGTTARLPSSEAAQSVAANIFSVRDEAASSTARSSNQRQNHQSPFIVNSEENWG